MVRTLVLFWTTSTFFSYLLNLPFCVWHFLTLDTHYCVWTHVICFYASLRLQLQTHACTLLLLHTLFTFSLLREDILKQSGITKADVISGKENADVILSGLELLSNQKGSAASSSMSAMQSNNNSNNNNASTSGVEKYKKKSDVPFHQLILNEDPTKIFYDMKLIEESSGTSANVYRAVNLKTNQIVRCFF